MDPSQLPLRDIHLPPDPAFWPPAPGWWIVALLLLCAAIAAWWKLRRRPVPAPAPVLELARRELAELRAASGTRDAAETMRAISEWLRRVVVNCHPRRKTAALTGERWLQFLDGSLPGRPFSNGPGRLLLDAPYRKTVDPGSVTPLFELCEQWLGSLVQVQREGINSHA